MSEQQQGKGGGHHKNRSHSAPRPKKNQTSARRSQSQDVGLDGRHPLSQHRVWRRSDSESTQEGSAPAVQQKNHRNPTPNFQKSKHGNTGSSGQEKKNVEKNNSPLPKMSASQMNMHQLVKMLAQVYGGPLDKNKEVELLHVCKQQVFVQQLTLFMLHMPFNAFFLFDLASVLENILQSLPSGVCAQFHQVVTEGARRVEQLGNQELLNKFAALLAKLSKHLKKLSSLQEERYVDFHLMPVLPPVLRLRPHGSGYLYDQFNLLFNESIGRYCKCLLEYVVRQMTSNNLKVVPGVRIVRPVLVSEQLCLVTTAKAWEDLLPGALLCLSYNDFHTVQYATVVQLQPQVVVELHAKVTAALFERVYDVADIQQMTEPSTRILEALQQMDERTLPFRRYLIDGNLEVNSVPAKVSPTLKLTAQQYEAFTAAMTQEVAAVTGGAGTGKTHVGCAVARVASRPVLVVCNSTDTLDEYLFRLSGLQVVCLGTPAQCKEEQLKEVQKAVQTSRYVALINMKKLQLSLEILEKNEAVVSLTSLREHGIINEQNFKCFLREPDTATVFYSWLIDATDTPHRDLTYPTMRCSKEDPILSVVQPSIRLAESVENIEQKRSEVHEEMQRLQRRFGNGEIVSEEMKVLREQYLQLSLILKRLKTYLTDKTESNPSLLGKQDLWNLNHIQRWQLYALWVAALKAKLQGKLELLHAQLSLEAQKLDSVQDLVNLRAARKADIVCTVASQAAKCRGLVEKLGSRTVVVDDAARIAEWELVPCLTQSCHRMVLIGNTRGKEVAQHNLMQRLIAAGLKAKKLKQKYQFTTSSEHPYRSEMKKPQ